jgi:hypothetical protein
MSHRPRIILYQPNSGVRSRSSVNAIAWVSRGQVAVVVWYPSQEADSKALLTATAEPILMLDLILRLVDRLIDLSKRHEEVNRSLFVDFIQPAFETFEIVHADYIDSLTRYSSRLVDTTLRMDLNHPVFGDIELDSLKSGHLRTKLTNFRPAISPPKLREFLSAIDFYLRGVSAAGPHTALVDKLARTYRDGLSVDDLGTLALERNRDDRANVLYNGPVPVLIYSDPMREALREILLGFDAPKDLDGRRERDLICEGAVSVIYRSEDQRRQVCSQVVKRAMEFVQHGYVFVSSAYSKLRSELLSPM